MSNDTPDDLQVRPTQNRQPVHPTITTGQISQLVEQFYAEIIRHPRLGPIFEANVPGDWNNHLEKMKTFWRSVLLRSGEYKGKPVPAHQKINDLMHDDFDEWLCVFAPTCRKIFEPDAAALVIEAAKRIATSLWLSRSNDIFAAPPVWNIPGDEAA